MVPAPPLSQTLRPQRRPQPLTLVIFGGTGDLARRKLIPALFRLWQLKLLPEEFAVVGVAREQLSDEAYRERMLEGMRDFAQDPGEAWAPFAARLFFGRGVYDEGGFSRLKKQLEGIEAGAGIPGNRLFYMAIPPQVVDRVVHQLGGAGLVCPAGCECWTRIVVEKPFGRDLASAEALNRGILEVFDESQVYRIDHYLGKETLQNLLVFRFANVVWEPLWSRNYVERVEITVAENVGLEDRADYYEQAGALRDMVQSHLMQILTLVAMEAPGSYDAESIRNEKVKVLRALRPLDAGAVARDTVRGQYTAGEVKGKRIASYRDEEGADPASRVETYAAVRLWVDNWRWAGVPFFLRTGKCLPAKSTEVVVRFRSAPKPITDEVGGEAPSPNALVLHVQPREGISLYFEAKVPGLAAGMKCVSMDFDYRTAFGDAESPEAYQRLLLDAMLGDATLFARRDEVEAAWALMTPILEAWEAGGEPEAYPAGSWGPGAADRLVGAGGWWMPA